MKENNLENHNKNMEEVEDRKLKEKLVLEESKYINELPRDFYIIDLQLTVIKERSKNLELSQEEKKFIEDLDSALNKVKEIIYFYKQIDDKLKDILSLDEYSNLQKYKLDYIYDGLYRVFSSHNFKKLEDSFNEKDFLITKAIRIMKKSFENLFNNLLKESERLGNVNKGKGDDNKLDASIF